jgi:protein-disulfide isomerase/uncharacterized membrane protein
VGLVIALLALGLSIALACKHEGLCTGGTACLIGNVDGCAELGKSDTSRLFGSGPHIAWLGVFYYAAVSLLFVAVLILRGARDASGVYALLLATVVFGFVFDLFLAYTNFMVLDVPCLFCIYTYICQVGILAVTGLLYYGHSFTRGNLTELWSGLKNAWWAFVGALCVVLLTYLLLPVFVGPSSEGSANGESFETRLTAPEKQAQLLRELRAFNKADLSTAGLASYDGADSAYIVLHDWADFRCPHCLHAHELIRAAQRRWPGRIKVYYRHFPLDQMCNPLVSREAGGYSCNGAQAALCAPEQGIFADFYHGVFELQHAQIPITPDQLHRLTDSLGGDWASMVNCMGSSHTQQALRRDIQEAQAINVQSTPTIVLQGHILPPGTPRPEFFFGLMDALVVEKEGDAAVRDFEARIAGGGR